MHAAAIIDWAGERIALRPERALHLPERHTLLLADLHLGKGRAYRQQGLPVPAGTTDDTLARLDALLAAAPARRLVFLGDLLHSRHAQGSTALAAFARWRARHAALALTLVRGNHDDHAGDPPADLGIDVVDEPARLGGLALCHHPQPPAAGALGCVAGHLHPALSLHGRADDHLRLPCFHLAAATLVLPAFGAFTGTASVQRSAGDRAWVIAEGEVREIVAAPGMLRRSRRAPTMGS